MRKMRFIVALGLSLSFLAALSIAANPPRNCGIAGYAPIVCGPFGTGVRDCPGWVRAECVSAFVGKCVDYSYYPQQNITVNCTQYANAVECALGFGGVATPTTYPDQFCVDI